MKVEGELSNIIDYDEIIMGNALASGIEIFYFIFNFFFLLRWFWNCI